MSNTGTYAWRNGKLVKLSDRVFNALTLSDVTFNKPFVTEDITGFPVEVKSARHKKELMRAHGLREPVDSKDVGARCTNSNRREVKGMSDKAVSQHFREKRYYS